MSRNNAAITIALILMFTVASFTIVAPAVLAQGPGTKLKTWLLVSASPNPVGVDQPLYLNAFMSKPAITSSNVFGDRYEDITMVITKPDGTKDNLGPFLADPTGGVWATYIPSTVGNYTLQAFYPGQILTGDNPSYPGETTHYGSSLNYNGTEMLPSESAITTFTVQEEPIEPIYHTPPLPSEYWSRPIYSLNREWDVLGGSWFSLRASGFATAGVFDATGDFDPYTTAPNNGHILWTKSTAFGGLVGDPIKADEESQYMSTSIATRSWEPIILYGILYYVHYPEHSSHPASWIAVDMRTGEEIWNRPCGITGNEVLRYGQIVQFHSIQEYGCNAYLWSVPLTGTTVLRLYDPMTCTYICEIVNGTRNLAMIADFECNEQGTLLGWYTDGDKLVLWNSTKAIAYPTGFDPAVGPQRTYRPSGSIAWNAGIEWSVPRNFSIASGFTGNLGIGRTTKDVILLRDSPNEYSGYSAGYQVTVGIDAKTGVKLWGPYNQTIPEARGAALTLIAGNEGVFVLHSKDLGQAWGYSLENGDYMWGPVKIVTNAWSYITISATVAYSNVYFYDFGGLVNCVDLETGELKWTFSRGSSGYDAPYGIYPFWTYEQSIVDGKLFLAEGSLYNPPLHPAKLVVINATSGELVWDILFYGARMNSAHADSMFVIWNSFDKQIYCFGQGQTATSVLIQDDVTTLGEKVLVKGMVTDESPGSKDPNRVARFPHGVPAVSEESQEAWMEYVYMQQIKPADVKGVDVVVSVSDPNGNTYDVGTTTSDGDGYYGLSFVPEVTGEYIVTARFGGSESYWGSFAKTHLLVEEAPSASLTPTPEPASFADMYFMPISIATIVAIVIIVILLLLLLFRKR